MTYSERIEEAAEKYWEKHCKDNGVKSAKAVFKDGIEWAKNNPDPHITICAESFYIMIDGVSAAIEQFNKAIEK